MAKVLMKGAEALAQAAISGGSDRLHLDYTTDVMELMTKARYEWGMKYPEEE